MNAMQMASRLGAEQLKAALAQAQQRLSSVQALLYSILHSHG
jgi:hypothetical protein